MVIAKQQRIQLITNIALIFLYVYNIAFSILPIFLRTRILIGGYGFIKELVKGYKLDKTIFNILILNILAISSVLLTGIITGNYGYWFIQHAALNIIYLFGGLYIAQRMVYGKSQSIDYILYLILYIIILHNVIAFVGFLYKPLGDLFLIVQKIESGGGAFEAITTFRSRIFGLGVGSFFTGGIISGLGIIINLYLIQKGYLTIKRGGILLIILLGTGLFIARTTMIGLLGILVFLKPTDFPRLVRVSIYLICIGCVIGFIMINFLREYLTVDWAFELFINYFSSDNLETSSTNELADMWVLPQHITTWIFGDGLFFNSDGSYYMHTDVGYLRIIYCIGIIGLGVLIINQLYLMYSLDKLCRQLRPLILTLGIYVLILNIKGFAEINFFYYLTIGYLISRKQSYVTQNKHYSPDL